MNGIFLAMLHNLVEPFAQVDKLYHLSAIYSTLYFAACTILASILPYFPARGPIFIVETGKNRHNSGLEETNTQRVSETRMKILLASEEITNRPREGTLVFLMH
ncbi:MAG: hypothetical protein ABR899_08155, partial [Candidatus Krumholzibacteriaceae bacterium]